MTNTSTKQFMKFINSSHSMYSSKNPQHSLCLHISSYDLYDGLKIMQYPAWLSNVHAIIQLQSLSCYLMGLSCISEVKTDLLLIFADYFSSFSPSRIDFPIILLEMGRSKTQDPSPTHSNSSKTQRQFLPDLSHLFQTFKGNKYPRSNIHDLNKKLGSKVNPNQKFVSGVKNWPDPSLA